MSKRILGLSSLVGNTPLLAIDFEYKGEKHRIYAKAENMNITESIKDRMAFHILSKSIEKGILKRAILLPKPQVAIQAAPQHTLIIKGNDIEFQLPYCARRGH